MKTLRKKNQRDGETMLETYHIKSADGVLSQARKIYDKREQLIVSFLQIATFMVLFLLALSDGSRNMKNPNVKDDSCLLWY